MRVCILGSQTLNVDEDDLFKLAERFIYPHHVDSIVTTNEDGIAATAREIARLRGVGLRVFDFYKRAVEDSTFVVIVRLSKEFPTYARYCSYKGKNFQEYVITK